MILRVEQRHKACTNSSLMLETGNPIGLMNFCTGDGHSLAEKAIDFQEPIMPFVSARTKKRKSGLLFHSSHVQTTAGASRKMRAIEKYGGPQQSFRGPSSPLQKKVDVVASPQKLLGGNYMHASSKDRTTRLQSELMALMMCGDPGISAFPKGDNIFCSKGTIYGSKDTVYQGMAYKLSLTFSMDYPFKPPKVKFNANCFHPIVDVFGNICLDILQILLLSYSSMSQVEEE